VLDAQYFGVPQRRRRVFVVGCLGDWVSPAKVLFESESLRRNNPKSKGKKQNSPAFTSSSFGGYGEGVGTIRASGGDLGGGSETLVTTGSGKNVFGTLQASAADKQWLGNQEAFTGDYHIVSRTQVYENHPTDSRVKEMGDTCTTVLARWGTGGGNVPIALAENTIGRKPENGGNGDGFTEDGPMYTLNATGVHGVAYGFEPGIAKREGSPARFVEDGTPTLRANMGDNQTATAYAVDVYNQAIDGNVTATLTQACGGTNTSGPKLMQQMAVRRLTPVECERLQGFPDDYTNIKPKCPDGPRYKAMGNSMAVPVMRWIGQRIKEVSCASK